MSSEEGGLLLALEKENDRLEQELASTRQVLTDTEAERDRLAERLELARKTAWVSVPIAAELVAIGDTIVGKDGGLMVVRATEEVDDVKVWIAVYGDDGPFMIKRDRPVPVLRRPTHDALKILGDQLGARVEQPGSPTG